MASIPVSTFRALKNVLSSYSAKENSSKKKAGRLDLLTYEEVLRGMNLEEPITLYRHASS
jgi:hypothetical protein